MGLGGPGLQHQRQHPRVISDGARLRNAAPERGETKGELLAALAHSQQSSVAAGSARYCTDEECLLLYFVNRGIVTIAQVVGEPLG